MVSGAIKAAVLGIVSLVVPAGVYIATDFSYTSAYWTTFSVGFDQYGTYVYNLTQFPTWDEALSALSFIMILIGVILLFALGRMPKVGSSLLLVGFLAYLADIAYGEAVYGIYYFIPIGSIILLVAAIVGLRAKVSMPMPTGSVPFDSTDQLVKLKSLLDSGAITKEEFEEQKKRILGS